MHPFLIPLKIKFIGYCEWLKEPSLFEYNESTGKKIAEVSSDALSLNPYIKFDISILYRRG
jgi:hypothetical protein